MEVLCSKFEKIWRNFCHFEKFWSQNRFFSHTSSASTHSLMIGTLAGGKLCIFGFFMVSYAFSEMDEAFHQVLDDQRGQNTMKITVLPPFSAAGSTYGRMNFWRGKWAPNWEILLGLDSRHLGLSNKLSGAWFWCREVPQKQAVRRATHRAQARYA